MTEQKPLYNSVAPLRNVANLVALIERVQTRSPNLPGMATYFGPSGYGKSTAATFAANKYQAHLVEVKSTWTKKKLCEAILTEQGVPPKRTVADMVDQIAEHLAITDVPLLIDEADLLVKRGMIEVVRDIYRGSGAPVILIGEENLPQALREWERVHGRMLDWVAALPGDRSDVDHLAPIYAPGVRLDDQMKAEVLSKSNRSIRRICINLDRIFEVARTEGIREVTLKAWDGRDFFTGLAPKPRAGLL